MFTPKNRGWAILQVAEKGKLLCLRPVKRKLHSKSKYLPPPNSFIFLCLTLSGPSLAFLFFSRCCGETLRIQGLCPNSPSGKRNKVLSQVGKEDAIKVIWPRDKEVSESVIMWQGSAGKRKKKRGLPIHKSLPWKGRQSWEAATGPVHANALPGSEELVQRSVQKATGPRCNIHVNHNHRNIWKSRLALPLTDTPNLTAGLTLIRNTFPLF